MARLISGDSIQVSNLNSKSMIAEVPMCLRSNPTKSSLAFKKSKIWNSEQNLTINFYKTKQEVFKTVIFFKMWPWNLTYDLDLGTKEKVLPQEIHMWNMKAFLSYHLKVIADVFFFF